MPRLSFAFAVMLLLLYTFFMCSCDKTKSSGFSIISNLEQNMISSNRIIHYSAQETLHVLEEKTFDPPTSEKAKLWFPKAKTIWEISDQLLTYIDSLKTELANIAKESNDNKPVSLVLNNGTATSVLQKKLYDYKEDVLNTDSRLRHTFEKLITITSKSFDSITNKKQNFYTYFFKNKSTSEASAILTLFENNILATLSRTITYCNEQVGSTIDFYTTYSAIIGQNSSVISAGEKIEITAGVGVFSTICKPEITVFGKPVELNDEGYALYKLTAPNNPGKYAVPVKLSFDDGFGKRMTIDKIVRYKVVEP